MIRFPTSAIRVGLDLIVWVEAEQNGMVSLWQLALQVRRVPERNDRQENPSLRRGSVELYSIGGLLGVRPKSHNVPHLLGMRRLMSIHKHEQYPIGMRHFGSVKFPTSCIRAAFMPTVWVYAEQHGVVSSEPLAGSTSRKVCARTQ